MTLFVGASESYDEDAWESYNLKKENAKLREENAKLVKVLHEVESEAVDAFLGLQHDCGLLTAELEDRFRKHWHEQCENAKLRGAVRIMAYCMQQERECDGCAMNGVDGSVTEHVGCDGLRDVLRELGIEVNG